MGGHGASAPRLRAPRRLPLRHRLPGSCGSSGRCGSRDAWTVGDDDVTRRRRAWHLGTDGACLDRRGPGDDRVDPSSDHDECPLVAREAARDRRRSPLVARDPTDHDRERPHDRRGSPRDARGSVHDRRVAHLVARRSPRDGRRTGHERRESPGDAHARARDDRKVARHARGSTSHGRKCVHHRRERPRDRRGTVLGDADHGGSGQRGAGVRRSVEPGDDRTHSGTSARRCVIIVARSTMPTHYGTTTRRSCRRSRSPSSPQSGADADQGRAPGRARRAPRERATRAAGRTAGGGAAPAVDALRARAGVPGSGITRRADRRVVRSQAACSAVVRSALPRVRADRVPVGDRRGRAAADASATGSTAHRTAHAAIAAGLTRIGAGVRRQSDAGPAAAGRRGTIRRLGACGLNTRPRDAGIARLTDRPDGALLLGRGQPGDEEQATCEPHHDESSSIHGVSSARPGRAPIVTTAWVPFAMKPSSGGVPPPYRSAGRDASTR